jgi:hypothetical protein
MRNLLHASEVDFVSYLNGEKDADALALIVHDGLVEHWDRPQAVYSTLPEELARKYELWKKVGAREQSLELGVGPVRESAGVTSIFGGGSE